MDADFPAAHSMDATWYAVDRNGHVGLFHTGEGGAMPEDAYVHMDPGLLEDVPEDVRDEMAASMIPEDQLPDEKDLFRYECDGNWVTGPYERTQMPKKPLHIDQLPPQLRDRLRKLCFESLDFRETESFQPVELTTCHGWDPAYLASDGKTVKPIPGYEEDYAKFYKEHADALRAEGLTVEEPTKKPAGRRKQKGGSDGD